MEDEAFWSKAFKAYPTGGKSSLLDRFADVVNLKRDFKAVGNGTADDSIPMALAVAAAAGKTLFIPDGVYLVSGDINVQSHTRIVGTGTLKLSDNTASVCLLAVQTKTDVVIDGITIDGNVAGQAVWDQQHHCILVQSSSYVTIRNVTFKNAIGDGIEFSRLGSPPYTGCSYCLVQGSSFIGTSLNRNGVSVICGTQNQICHNLFTAQARPFMPGAIDAEPADADDFIDGLLINDNRIVGHDLLNLVNQTGISLDNSMNATIRGVIITGNVIEGNFQVPIYLKGGVAGGDTAKISGNYIRNCSYTAPDIARAISTRQFDAAITENYIDTVLGSGIWVETGEVYVVGNYIRRVQKQGIVMGAPTTGKVSNNRIIDAGLSSTTPFRAGIYLETSGVEYTNNSIISNDISSTLYGFISPSGTGNYFDGNYIRGIGLKNYELPGSQIWGVNGFVTAGSTDDTTVDRVTILQPKTNPLSPVQLLVGGVTAAHVGFQFDNGLMRLIKGNNSAYADAQMGNVTANGSLTAITKVIGHGLVQSSVKVTALYNILGTDFVIYCDTSAGGFSVFLPAAAAGPGGIWVVKKISSDGNTLGVGTFAGTIDGVVDVTTTTKAAMWFQSDGTNYNIL